VSSVLAGEANNTRKTAGSDIFKSNEADPRDGMIAVKFRTEGRRKMALHHRWINPEVNQQSSLDRAMYLWKPHNSVSPIPVQPDRVNIRTHDLTRSQQPPPARSSY
jgi:hypothetical protein